MSDARRKRDEKKEGELRMSSAMLGAGPGALLDLTNTSVMIASLDLWGNPLLFKNFGPRFQEVKDHRLQEYVRRSLEAPDAVRLFHPAPAEDEDGVPSENGVRAWTFPEWFVTREYVDPLRTSRTQRSRVLVHARSLKGGELEIETDDDDLLGKRPGGTGKSRGPRERSKKVAVVPVRFVRACPRGHIEDLDWPAYAHPRSKPCGGLRSLRLEERGTSGDLAELFVVCVECKTEQSMVRATEFDKQTGHGALGPCSGRELWKGQNARVACNTWGKRTAARLLVRSASNAWFGASLSAITLPDADATTSEIRKLIDVLWDDVFSGVTEALDLRGYRKNLKYKEALTPYSDDDLVAECARRRSETEVLTLTANDPERPTGPKAAEIETFLAVDGHAGADEIGSLFFAESTTPPPRKGASARRFVDRVVLVHRLREVRALVGFTRFEAPVTTLDGELDLDVSPAALASHKQWVPAVENHGEGVFLSLDPDRVNAWCHEPAVKARRAQLHRGFERWREERGTPKSRFLDLPYILLHSLAHLLTTAVALECGYPSSSIRERIYALGDRYGILLFTASADAEGTLGGLVATGRQLERHLQAALEIGRLCSNDPVCAGHDPDNASGELTLQGAACHGCLLISETSCERQNTWLDRALVVQTVADRDSAFFRGW